MPVSRGLGITIPSDTSFYRVTQREFRLTNSRNHRKVVNGAGAIHSRYGARYNYPGVRTVYLTEDPLTCLAEKMFYFHQDVLACLDHLHLGRVAPPMPPFLQTFVLWDIVFRKPIPNVFDLTLANAPAAGVFPSLLLNPSQDYSHLKDRRAEIQACGYRGIRTPSTRATHVGNMVILFDDQSANVASITHYDVEFRLLTSTGMPFTNHATDQLDYLSGEVRVLSSGVGSLPASLSGFGTWTHLAFQH